MTPQEHMTQTLDFVQKSLGDKALPHDQTSEDSGAATPEPMDRLLNTIEDILATMHSLIAANKALRERVERLEILMDRAQEMMPSIQ